MPYSFGGGGASEVWIGMTHYEASGRGPTYAHNGDRAVFVLRPCEHFAKLFAAAACCLASLVRPPESWPPVPAETVFFPNSGDKRPTNFDGPALRDLQASFSFL